jgi:hypothetical protein
MSRNGIIIVLPSLNYLFLIKVSEGVCFLSLFSVLTAGSSLISLAFFSLEFFKTLGLF